MNKRLAKGFSLIELMLALGLGVVVTAGIIQLFVGNSETYKLLNGQARMQEGGRFALDFISRSARTAGYIGCDPDADKVYNSLNGNWNQVFEFDITQPIQAFHGINNGNALADWTPSLTPLPRNTGAGTSVNTAVTGNGVDVTTLKPQTDILVLRHVEIPGARTASIVQPGASPVVQDAANLNFGVNDFVLISNCEQAALFKITAITVAGTNATLTRGTGGGIFDNDAGANLSEQGIPYGEANNGQGTSVGRVLSDIYFIAQGTGTNNRGDTPWSLWRKVASDAPVELVEGIEDLQVLFGIDNTNNNIAAANRYVTFDQVGTNAIRALRISITANSVDAVTNKDQKIVRTFSQTISFRN